MRNNRLKYPLLATLLFLGACGGPGSTSPLDGAAIYSQTCTQCHGPEGEGRNGPSFRGNSSLADPATMIDRVLTGSDGMPAYRDDLSDAEIAAVLTHIRTSWGNSFGAVDTQQVAARRAAQ